jgi:hypothetical protein
MPSTSPVIDTPLVCKNCNADTSGAYCSACGQKSIPERITFSYIWHELFHFFTHIKHGFLFTTKELLRSPGPMVTSYIDGRRKVHQSPVSYFLIWVAAFISILYALVKLFGENVIIDYGDYFGPGASTAFAISNLSVMLAFIVPIQALYLYLLVTRGRYNYMETVAMIIYAVGTIIFLQLIFALVALLQFVVTRQPLMLQWSDGLKAGYFAWFVISLLMTLRMRIGLVRGLGFMLLAGASFTFWRLFVVPWLAGMFVH